MIDHEKSRDQLILEIALLRQRVAELEDRLNNELEYPGSGPSEHGCYGNGSTTDERFQKYADKPQELFIRQDKELEAVFQSLMTCSTDSIVVYDAECRVKYLNRAFTRLFGWTLEEAAGVILDTIPDWDLEGFNGILEKVLKQGLLVECHETHRFTKEGRLLSVSIDACRYLDNNGVPAGIVLILRDLSHRKQIEDSLQESEQKFRLAFEHANVGVCLVDLEGNVLKANDRLGQILGYPQSEVERFNVNDLAHPDDRDLSPHFMNGALSGYTQKVEFEKRYIHKDGQIVFGRVSSALIRDRQGKPLYFISTLQDLTESKRAEKALRESEARFRSYFDLPLIGIAITAPDKGWIDVNQALCSMLGYSKDELTGMTWSQLTHPDDLEADVAQFDRVVSGEIDNYYLEKRFIRKDGSAIWTNLSVGCVRKSDNTLDYIVALLQDITLRKIAEKALMESEEKFRLAVDTSPDAMCITNVKDGRIIEINKSFTRMTGHTRNDALNRTTTQIDIWQNPDDRQNILRLLMEKGSCENQEIVFRRKDGNLFVGLVSASLMPYHGEPHVMSMTRDITDRIQAQNEKEALQERLFHSQKLASLGTLVGGLAHDFNNMLQIICGYTEILMAGSPKDSREYSNLKAIHDTSMQGAELVKKLLAFGQKAPAFPKPMDINEKLVEFCRFPLINLPDDIALKLDLLDRPALIRIDPNQIDQVLLNLAINASDAMPAGGQLTISTREIILDENSCNNMVEARPGSYIALTVKDNGIGIPEEHIPKLFDPFFTSKQRGSARGTGLGLSVVRGIVQQHGGFITVRSKPGFGSEFTLYFPTLQDRRPGANPDSGKTKPLFATICK